MIWEISISKQTRLFVKLISQGLFCSLLFSSFPVHADIVKLPGVLRPTQKAIISAQQAGIVTKLKVMIGQVLDKNDLILRLDCKLIESQLELQQAETAGAQIRLDNDRILVKLNSIGQEQVQLDELELRKAKARETAAEIAKDRCDIRAPFDGAANQIFINEYETIELNQPIVEWVSQEGALIEFLLPSEVKVEIGQIVTASINDEAINAKIFALNIVVDSSSQTRIGLAQVSEIPSNWVLGSAVEVSFNYE